MAEEHKPLLLLEFMFGESAETARRAASGRLLAWAEAFEAWMVPSHRSRVGIFGPGSGNMPPQQTSSRGEPGTGCNKCGINSDRPPYQIRGAVWEPGGKADIQRKDCYGIHQKGNICEE